jgi:transposase
MQLTPPESSTETRPPLTGSIRDDQPDAIVRPRKGGQAWRPGPATYTLRLQYAPESSGPLPLKDGDLLPNWSRVFTASGGHTLEQLSDIILDILDWDRCHLYEFSVAEQVYCHLVCLEEPELFVDSGRPCVSCDIPIRLLGLATKDVFGYMFDFGDCHTFEVTVIDIQSVAQTAPAPALISWQGKNIIQYPGTMARADARAFENRPPTAGAPERQEQGSGWRVRFIRAADRVILDGWRASNDRRLWQKAVTILENRNHTPEAIASKLELSIGHVQGWVRAFNRYGLAGLSRPRKPRAGGERELKRDQNARRVLEIVHARPSAYGINRSNWSLSAIAVAFQREHQEAISTTTVCRMLRKAGYAMRKARRVLSSPDPDYREKVDLLLSTLQNLKPGELLFFVDELGPLRVKKYGGRALARRGDALEYPQEQGHRGVVTMCGALSATTNQVTWIYGRSKDSSAMIDLMELLYNQYATAAKLYVTWDAASWHRSAMVVEWLDAFNAITRSTDDGPLIDLIPLPTSAQFLDVIEAVFSGMKRAVIHHSDYRDAREMKVAISRHFAERNAHFLENPRRAGERIWDVDFFADNENLRSGNYREW